MFKHFQVKKNILDSIWFLLNYNSGTHTHDIKQLNILGSDVQSGDKNDKNEKLNEILIFIQ